MVDVRAAAKKLERRVRSFLRRLPDERWDVAPYVSSDRPIIVGGCGRSGTTLTSVMLNAHRNICCGPETRLFTTPGVNPARLAEKFDFEERDVRQWIRESNSKYEFIERFFRQVAGREGKPGWAEKTPGNVKVLDEILARFPQAKFIHVIRDGRDVACSYRTYPKYKFVNGERVPTNIHRPIAECAQRWNEYVRAGIRHRGEAWYYELRYEELIEDPERVLRETLSFLDEPWDGGVLNFHTQDGTLTQHVDIQRKPVDAAAQGRWRRDLSADDAAIVKRIAGELLNELGYASDDAWQPDDVGATAPSTVMSSPNSG